MSDESDYEPDTHAEPQPPAAVAGIKDTELEPFSADRFIAAQSMGLTYPVANEDFRTDGGLAYKGELLDAVMAIWLCSIPVTPDPKKPNDWNVRKAMRAPDRAMEAALRWGAERGISVPESEAFWDAINRWEKIIIELRRAHTIPAAHAGTTDPKA